MIKVGQLPSPLAHEWSAQGSLPFFFFGVKQKAW